MQRKLKPLTTMSGTHDDATGSTEPPKTLASGSKPVNRDVVKEIVMEVLSGLRETSSKQPGSDNTTRKEAGTSGKYKSDLQIRVVPYEGAWPNELACSA